MEVIILVSFSRFEKRQTFVPFLFLWNKIPFHFYTLQDNPYENLQIEIELSSLFKNDCDNMFYCLFINSKRLI